MPSKCASLGWTPIRFQNLASSERVFLPWVIGKHFLLVQDIISYSDLNTVKPLKIERFFFIQQDFLHLNGTQWECGRFCVSKSIYLEQKYLLIWILSDPYKTALTGSAVFELIQILVKLWKSSFYAILHSIKSKTFL